jgi:hypothetical protein
MFLFVVGFALGQADEGAAAKSSKKRAIDAHDPKAARDRRQPFDNPQAKSPTDEQTSGLCRRPIAFANPDWGYPPDSSDWSHRLRQEKVTAAKEELKQRLFQVDGEPIPMRSAFLVDSNDHDPAAIVKARWQAIVGDGISKPGANNKTSRAEVVAVAVEELSKPKKKRGPVRPEIDEFPKVQPPWMKAPDNSGAAKAGRVKWKNDYWQAAAHKRFDESERDKPTKGRKRIATRKKMKTS